MIEWHKKELIAKRLMEFGEHLNEQETLEEDECNPVKNPLKFLFSVIFDQGIPWERAWEAPTELERRLGHLDIARIAKMDRDELEEILRQPPALHRFPGKLADWLIEACKLLLTKYGGNPEKIWSGAPTAKEIENKCSTCSPLYSLISSLDRSVGSPLS